MPYDRIQAFKTLNEFNSALKNHGGINWLNNNTNRISLKNAFAIILDEDDDDDMMPPRRVAPVGRLQAALRSTSKPSPTFTVRIFPDDETTEMVYPVVTHAFMEAGNTILTLCLPNGEHAHWPRERFRHYSVTKNPATDYLDDPRHT